MLMPILLQIATTIPQGTLPAQTPLNNLYYIGIGVVVIGITVAGLLVSGVYNKFIHKNSRNETGLQVAFPKPEFPNIIHINDVAWGVDKVIADKSSTDELLVWRITMHTKAGAVDTKIINENQIIILKKNWLDIFGGEAVHWKFLQDGIESEKDGIISDLRTKLANSDARILTMETERGRANLDTTYQNAYDNRSAKVEENQSPFGHSNKKDMLSLAGADASKSGQGEDADESSDDGDEPEA